MPEEITPQANPIQSRGEPTWYPSPQDDDEPHVEKPSTLRSIFFGPDGLRAGWSLLLFIAITFAIGLCCFQVLIRTHLLPRVQPRGETLPLQVILGELVQLCSPVLAALIMSRIERRRFRQYGLGVFRPRQFLVGLACGLLALSVLVGALWGSGLLVFGGRLLSGASVLTWGAVWALAFLLVGLSEEFTTRAYVQFTLARGLAGIGRALGMDDRSRKPLGFWLAALVFSFLFAIGHKNNPGESPIGLWSAGLIGLAFCFSLWRTGSLWWAVGFHAAWDWAQSFLYGVADSGLMVQHHFEASHPQGKLLLSGGLTGPEGSVYVLGVIVLVAVTIALTLKPQAGSASRPETWDLSAEGAGADRVLRHHGQA